MKPNYHVNITTASLLKTALIIALAGFLWYIREIVLIFFVSLLLAALIEPFAEWFAKRNIPRVLAVLIVYIVLLTFVTLLVLGLAPVMIDQFKQLGTNFAQFSKGTNSVLSQIQSFGAEYGFTTDLMSGLRGLETRVAESFGSVFTTVRGVIGGVATGLIVLVLTFYMVAEGDKMHRYFKQLAPIEYQPFLMDISRKMQTKIGAWLRGQLFLGFVIGAASYIGLSALGVPYAPLLALIAAFCELIPYVGPIFSALPALLVAFVQEPALAPFVLILYIVIQQVENNVLVPKVMQKVTGVNPIVSILALMVGVKLGGFIGAFFAIPLAMMGTVVMDEIFNSSSHV